MQRSQGSQHASGHYVRARGRRALAPKGLSATAIVVLTGFLGVSGADASWSLDGTYGNAGLERLRLPGNLSSPSFLQTTIGTYVVAGLCDPCSSAVLRFDQDGNLDRSYGPGSRGIARMGDGTGGGEAFVADGSARVVMARYDELTRLTSDGIPDSAFGEAGAVSSVALPRIESRARGQFSILGVAAVPSGGLYVATGLGLEGDREGDERLTAVGLTRLDPAGATDVDFNGGQAVPLPALTRTRDVRCLATRSDGGALVGRARSVTAYTTTGALDRTFGQGGTLDLSRVAPGFTLAQTGGLVTDRPCSVLPNGNINVQLARATRFRDGMVRLVQVSPDGRIVGGPVNAGRAPGAQTVAQTILPDSSVRLVSNGSGDYTEVTTEARAFGPGLRPLGAFDGAAHIKVPSLNASEFWYRSAGSFAPASGGLILLREFRPVTNNVTPSTLEAARIVTAGTSPSTRPRPSRPRVRIEKLEVGGPTNQGIPEATYVCSGACAPAIARYRLVKRGSKGKWSPRAFVFPGVLRFTPERPRVIRAGSHRLEIRLRDAFGHSTASSQILR